MWYVEVFICWAVRGIVFEQLSMLSWWVDGTVDGGDPALPGIY